MAGKASFADHMIIVSGTSSRHIASMTQHLVERLKAAGLETPHVEGLPQADWVLLDAGDAVVHLFRPEVRNFYNLEKLWSVAAPTPETADSTAAPTPRRRTKRTSSVGAGI
ncbi:MAG: ribosome silencing factor [Alphaproteobacteria bacterium]